MYMYTHVDATGSAGRVSMTSWVSRCRLCSLQTNSHSWSVVFFGMSGCFVVALVVFLLFSTGEEQPWAKDDVTEEIEPIVRNVQESD